MLKRDALIEAEKVLQGHKDQMRALLKRDALIEAEKVLQGHKDQMRALLEIGLAANMTPPLLKTWTDAVSRCSKQIKMQERIIDDLKRVEERPC